MLIINNKNTKNMPILRFLLRALSSNISVPSHFFYYRIENPDNDNKNS